MNVLEFIASLISSFAWPIAIFALAYLFREPLTKILYSLTTLKYGGLEMDFQRELAEVEAAAKDAKLEIDSPMPEHFAEGGYEAQDRPLLERVEALSRDHLDAAVALAWREVEAELTSAVARLAVSPEYPPHNSPTQNMRYLYNAGYLDEDTYNLLRKLQSLANLVAHGRYRHGQISLDEVLEYAAIAQAVISRLRKLTRNKEFPDDG